MKITLLFILLVLGCGKPSSSEDPVAQNQDSSKKIPETTPTPVKEILNQNEKPVQEDNTTYVVTADDYTKIRILRQLQKPQYERSGIVYQKGASGTWQEVSNGCIRPFEPIAYVPTLVIDLIDGYLYSATALVWNGSAAGGTMATALWNYDTNEATVIKGEQKLITNPKAVGQLYCQISRSDIPKDSDLTEGGLRALEEERKNWNK